MDLRKLRAYWSHKQGLDSRLEGCADGVLENVGWFRSVGGSSPYLGLFVRTGQLRVDVDREVAEGSVGELPSVRGCTYILPKCHFDLGLRLSLPYAEKQVDAACKNLGVTREMVASLEGAILASLSEATQDPTQLRKSVAKWIVDLGPAGKKKGLTSTLPLALGLLQSKGHIQRVPINGRLDQQRYAYRYEPRSHPVETMPLNDAYQQLADLYWRWAGPARSSHFEWFSGLGKQAARQLISNLGLHDLGDGWLIHAHEQPAFHTFEPTEGKPLFVGCLDNHLMLRRDLGSLLEPEDLSKVVPSEGGMKSLGELVDLDSHAILRDGRVIGVWDFDPENGRILWKTIVGADQVEVAAREMESMIADQLGDARTFSLDSPQSRREKLKHY